MTENTSISTSASCLESKNTPSTSHRSVYPAFLIVEGKLCVVVGGGSVAARKARTLLASGAHVRIISLSLHPDLQQLLTQGQIDYIPASYTSRYLAGAHLVFAATNAPEVNLQVVHDAHKHNLLVNVVDNPAYSDFYVPATISRQNIMVAISTGGEAPAFARYVKELLEQALSNSLGLALEMVASARPLILAQPEEKQAQLWNSLLSLRLETVLETQGYTAARQIFEAWLAEHLSNNS